MKNFSRRSIVELLLVGLCLLGPQYVSANVAPTENLWLTLLVVVTVVGRTPVSNLFYSSVLLTEAFVVAFEAALLFVLSRKTLSLTQAAVISLAMNLASFLAGQVLF